MSVLSFDTGVRVPMGDGCLLAATVVRPAGPGAWPAVLMRTPYDRSTYSSETLQVHATALAAYGYAVVLQDVRGRGASQGTFEPFVNEQQDGLDSVEWIAAQPWCNDSIALAGISYNAFNQTAIAAANPEEVKCWIPALGASDVRTSWIRRGGVPDMGFHLAWALGSVASLDRRTTDPESLLDAYDVPMRVGRREPSDQPELMSTEAGAWYFDWVGSADPYKGDTSVPGHAEIAAVAVPALVVAGWFDVFSTGSLELLGWLREGPASDSHRLVAGPWDHSGLPFGRRAGDRDFGRHAIKDLHRLQMRWLDQHLRGGEEVAADRVFVTGRDEWVNGHWPLGSEEWTLTLGDDLKGTNAAEDRVFEVWVDPDDPTPTVGGALFPWDPVLRPGAFDQRDRRARNDVVSFETGTLGSSVLAVGEPTLTIPVETPGDGKLIHARLVEVPPSGPVWNVSDGVGVIDASRGVSSIRLGPIAHAFAPGSAIGVDIAFAADVRLPPPQPGKRVIDLASAEGALVMPVVSD